MKNWFPFLFLIFLYLYTYHTDDLTFIHKPIISIILYVFAIIVCGAIFASLKKEASQKSAKK